MGALVNLGGCLLKLGRVGEAEEVLRRAVTINGDMAEAQANLGAVLAEVGKMDEARRACLRAIELSPGLAEAHNALGFVQKACGEVAEKRLPWVIDCSARSASPEADDGPVEGG